MNITSPCLAGKMHSLGVCLNDTDSLRIRQSNIMLNPQDCDNLQCNSQRNWLILELSHVDSPDSVLIAFLGACRCGGGQGSR